MPLLHRGVSSTGMNLDARWWWWVLNAMLRPLYRREWSLVPIVQEAVWAPGPVSMGMEKREFLTPTAVRTQNCPAMPLTLSPPHSGYKSTEIRRQNNQENGKKWRVWRSPKYHICVVDFLLLCLWFLDCLMICDSSCSLLFCCKTTSPNVRSLHAYL
jgi:hypothetical protein